MPGFLLIFEEKNAYSKLFEESDFDSIVEFTVSTYVSVVFLVKILLASSILMFTRNFLNLFASIILSSKSILTNAIF